jgi:hypothetical protein
MELFTNDPLFQTNVVYLIIVRSRICLGTRPFVACAHVERFEEIDAYVLLARLPVYGLLGNATERETEREKDIQQSKEEEIDV